jgi:hypothetical protein
VSDEELEEKGALGATLGELREAFQQGRAGGDGGAASVVAGEASDVVSRAGREAETRGRGPGRPRKPVPETSKPQAGGIGSAVGATLDAVTPGQLPFDGDGDERVFDGTPQERQATPAEIAASRAGGKLQEAAQSAVPGQGADGSRGSSPEGISQRIARSAGRMAARVGEVRKERSGPFGGKPDDSGFKQFVIGRKLKRSELGELTSKVDEGRKLRAGNTSKRAKQLADDNFEPVDKKDPLKRKHLEFYAGLVAEQGDRDLRDLDADGYERMLDYVEDRFKEKKLGISVNKKRDPATVETKPRFDNESQGKVKDLVTISLDRSPVLAELVDRHGLPRVFIGDRMDDESAVESSVLGAFFHNLDAIVLNGHGFDTDPDLPDQLPDQEIGHGTLKSMESVFRHEMGHRMERVARYSKNGTAEQEEGINEVYDYFNENHKEIADIRIDVAQDYVTKGMDAVWDRVTPLSQEEKQAVKKTMWMSHYGHTDRSEFAAELFRMATSDDPEMLEAVPEALRPSVVKWLGVDPWEML